MQSKDPAPRRGIFKNIIGVLLIALLLFNTFQLMSFGAVVNTVAKYNQGVVDEMGGLRGDVITFAQDLNEIREFLLLPTKEYSFGKEENSQPTDEKSTSQTEVAIYSFLGKITNQEKLLKNRQDAENFHKELTANQEFLTTLQNNQLTLGESQTTDTTIITKIQNAQTNEPLFSIISDRDENKLRVLSALENHPITAYPNQPQVIQDLSAYFQTNKEKVQTYKNQLSERQNEISQLHADEEVKKILESKKLKLATTPQDTEKTINYAITSEAQENLLEIQISKSSLNFNFSSKEHLTLNTLKSDLLASLNSIDAAGPEQRMINDRRQELEQIFSQPAFQDLLKNSNLTLDSQPRQEYNKLLFDVKNTDGKIQFSFVIELSSGIFKILKDNQEIDLNSLTAAEGSKKKP